MKIAFWTPLPPTKSGIAHYSSMLLPELARRYEVTAVVATAGDVVAFERFSSDEGNGENAFRVVAAAEAEAAADGFDLAVYQLGNNPHHEFIYRQALRRAGLVVLHEVVLHHLIVEMTLARGDAGAYVDTMRRNHGAAGAAFAEGRAAGLHGEIGNFLFPASVELASSALAVIVHNDYASERLRSWGVATRIEVIGHPFAERPGDRGGAGHASRLATRRALGAEAGDRLVGLFGFVTSAKRIAVVMEAFARAAHRDSRLRLAVVGEPAPNIDLDSIAKAYAVGPGLWRSTGYVAEESFDRYLEAVDAVVNLRYPTAGETSGALIRTFAIGRPVAVSQYAQFAEYPPEVAAPIPIGAGEVDALTRFLLADGPQPTAQAQHRWLRRHNGLAGSVDRYAAVIDAVGDGARTDDPGSRAAIHSALPLFPNFTVSSLETSVDRGAALVRFSITNGGPGTVPGRTYGEVSYRMIVKLLCEGREVGSRWLELPSDVLAGGTAQCDVSLPVSGGKLTLELHHALDEIENPLSRPWFRAELS
jgi:glycosyltransferase involved in cell wall biosynthesis